uniref:Trehalose 6-phosphate phosphatase n=1 Tax=Hyaloperonospora arabidopsidis (strain Emoy2) TaxID=559515 RepID=M4B4M0_HYAAE
MSTAAPTSAETSLPSASQELQRPRRLSVTTANALTNFSELQSHFYGHRLVVFLDYDGTLTPIVNDPALALLSPTMKHTLEKLREQFIAGVITGRSLDKIQKFVGIPQLYYAGSHGFDIKGPDGTSIKNQVATPFLADLRELRDELQAQIQDIEGAEVEDNVFSVSLHFRCRVSRTLGGTSIHVSNSTKGRWFTSSSPSSTGTREKRYCGSSKLLDWTGTMMSTLSTLATTPPMKTRSSSFAHMTLARASGSLSPKRARPRTHRLRCVTRTRCASF